MGKGGGRHCGVNLAAGPNLRWLDLEMYVRLAMEGKQGLIHEDRMAGRACQMSVRGHKGFHFLFLVFFWSKSVELLGGKRSEVEKEKKGGRTQGTCRQ